MTTSLLIEEVWNKVPSVEYLWASSLGRVCSEPYQTPMPYGGFKTNKLEPTYGVTQKMSANYQRKVITFRRKTYKVASLVAEAFLGERPQGLDVSHEDEDSFNNKSSNLEYRSRKYNLNLPKIKQYHREVCRNKMTALGLLYKAGSD